jgi:hypothetical protein
MRRGRRTDRHDEANECFSQFLQTYLKTAKCTFVVTVQIWSPSTKILEFDDKKPDFTKFDNALKSTADITQTTHELLSKALASSDSGTVIQRP